MNFSVFSGLKQTIVNPSTNPIESPLRTYLDFRFRFHCARVSPFVSSSNDSISISLRISQKWTQLENPIRIFALNSMMVELNSCKFPFDVIPSLIHRSSSACAVNTLNPIWNEEWIVRNVLSDAKLTVTIYDKDDGTLGDDYIGKFEIVLKAMMEQWVDIRGRVYGHHGEFQLSIVSLPRLSESFKLHPYTFDGPVRYSRRNSRTIGLLTKNNHEDRIHSTWEISLRRINFYFHPQDKQTYNSSYTPAKKIFDGPGSDLCQSAIQKLHRILYAKHTTNQFGSIQSLDDFWKLFIDPTTGRIKPCIYTYIINDHTWRFSETGASFFQDYTSKHALHANCAKTVVYAGQFHPRPIGGWKEYDIDQIRSWDQWELVLDNESGTYAPTLDLLQSLKDLFSLNFPGLTIVTYDYKDPELKSSTDTCLNFNRTARSTSLSTLQNLVFFVRPD